MKKIFTLFLLLSAVSAYSVEITFKVSMKGSGVDMSAGVFLAGGVYNGSWGFNEMTNEGDSLYSVTLDLTAGDTIAYYFITNNSWTNYEDYREPSLSTDCDGSDIIGWEGDRGFIVPSSATTYSYIWGSCDSPGTSAIESDLIEESYLTVFPNPATGSIRVNSSLLSEGASIEVINLCGKSVILNKYSKKTSEAVIDLTGLSSGIYLLKAYTGCKTLSRKLVVK